MTKTNQEIVRLKLASVSRLTEAQRIQQHEEIKVIWRAWDAGFERSFHGEPAEYNIGCIDE